MNKTSIWAIVAGILFVIVVTTSVDIILHMVGYFPPRLRSLRSLKAFWAAGCTCVRPAAADGDSRGYNPLRLPWCRT